MTQQEGQELTPKSVTERTESSLSSLKHFQESLRVVREEPKLETLNGYPQTALGNSEGKLSSEVEWKVEYLEETGLIPTPSVQKSWPFTFVAQLYIDFFKILSKTTIQLSWIEFLIAVSLGGIICSIYLLKCQLQGIAQSVNTIKASQTGFTIPLSTTGTQTKREHIKNPSLAVQTAVDTTTVAVQTEGPLKNPITESLKLRRAQPPPS